jgi:fused signal recognition particle receptor
MGFFNKLFGLNKEQKESLDQGLEKTKTNFFSKIAKALIGKDTVDEEVLDQLEEALIGADVGLTTTVAIINKIESHDYLAGIVCNNNVCSYHIIPC